MHGHNSPYSEPEPVGEGVGPDGHGEPMGGTVGAEQRSDHILDKVLP